MRRASLSFSPGREEAWPGEWSIVRGARAMRRKEAPRSIPRDDDDDDDDYDVHRVYVHRCQRDCGIVERGGDA